MISAAEASARILATIQPMPAEDVWLVHANGYVLAEDVIATVKHPPRGEDFSVGDTLMTAGTTITPAAIGLLASAGVTTVRVYRRPTVAIVTAGDELVMLDRFNEVRAGRRVVSSNSYTLPALVHEARGIARDCGIAANTPESLRQMIEASLGCDLLITSAELSGGYPEQARQALAALSDDINIWPVGINPGAPLAFGHVDSTPWIGLPGEPVSAVVAFELFARPAIRKMCGHTLLFPAVIDVTLAEDVTTEAPLTHFLQAIIKSGSDGCTARLAGSQSATALRSMAAANALLVVPDDRQTVLAGTTLRAIPLGPTVSMMTSAFPV